MKENKNIIIAHRGIHNNKNIPENSLLAFKLAIEENLPIELDIQLTKDNIPIIFHDSNTIRMTHEDKIIEDLTFEEIKKINLLETTEKIPTLEEVLNLIKGKVLLDIELKPTKKKEKLISTTLNILKKYNGQVFLKSFDPKIVKLLKKKKTSYPCGLLLTFRYPNRIYNFLMQTSLPIIYCNPDFLAISKKISTRKNILEYKKEKAVFIWTIKNKEELNYYFSKDFSCICNNLPYKN